MDDIARLAFSRINLDMQQPGNLALSLYRFVFLTIRLTLLILSSHTPT